MTFDVLIDDSYVNIFSDSQETHKNKKALSFLNDFENGQWRIKKFMRFLYDNMAYTALNHAERKALIDCPNTLLETAAKNIQVSDKGGEIGEILLYGIMNKHYKALSANAKIFYKQNTKDPAKGADSVHIICSENDFSLWLGESKFYSDSHSKDKRKKDAFKRAIKDAITSVSNFLNNMSQINKEKSLLLSVTDLDEELKEKNIDTKIQENIKNLLKPDCSFDNLKPKLNIPILILYECSTTEQNQIFDEAYKEEIRIEQTKYIKDYFNKHFQDCSKIFLYEKITFHLILFPVPNKQKIISKFNDRITALRE